MNKNLELLEGDITKNLFKLSIPIIMTSLVSIFYNLISIKFVSYYVGDNAVTSVTAASFFLSFSYALLFITKNGAQIYVAQSIGASSINKAKIYARVSLILAFILSLIYMLITFVFAPSFIMLVGVKNQIYLYPAIEFLKISSIGFIFLFIGQTLAAIINGKGDTMGPFIILSSGLIMNIFLDFFFLGIMKEGVRGAAIATLISQILSCFILYLYFKRKKSIFNNIKIFVIDEFKYYVNVIKIGLPSGLGQALFTLIAIVIAQMISQVDESILGVQRLGVQLESFSWNIASGFSIAVATFIAHNYGAKRYSRISSIYKISVISISILCFILTLIFVFLARPLYEIFLSDEKLINEGTKYLTIIGLAQIPQGIESITTGAFNGIGKTREPNFISIFGTAIRIPIVKILLPVFGLVGIWWTIHFSMVIKGLVSMFWFIIIWIRFLKENTDNMKAE
ncbi:MATE family efflux transporter [Pseudostreptobacillus hongkongensis]|uniref:MATE family efflux transporter n=1 Tax=Pseudostreptobacillus hongkongensis TaxID=1162717 RepID=UPI000830321E|nr:MATE family efflux transporter [Pseudostreptobacillus hongkongensis]